MTKSDFVEALARELEGVSFVRSDLERFVDEVWPAAEKDPDLAWWVSEYVDRLAGRTMRFPERP
jgi:hypothetical protein